MKYSIEFVPLDAYHAGYKAVIDITRIIHELGYVPLVIGNGQLNSFSRRWQTLYNVLKLFFLLKRGDECFVQWPTGSRLVILLYYVFRIKKVGTQLLIHDLRSIRDYEKDDMEMLFLNYSGIVIAHTPSMKDLLISKGISSDKVRLMTTFDYLIDNKEQPYREYSRDIVFAGNFAKSKFLQELMKHPLDFNLNCYGKKVIPMAPPLVYKGFFSPGEIKNIEGSWGLVWDGDSISSCSGAYGEYMRVNSPHKVSLYIVARLPVIMWEEAALAYYVKENGLGILVKSLNQIPLRLKEVNKERYNQLLSNIDKERHKLINGQHLKSCF